MNPVNMEIVKNTYPTAGRVVLFYEKTVSLKALRAAFAAKFSGQQLDLGRHMVFLHGSRHQRSYLRRPTSLDDIPAQVTLPNRMRRDKEGSID